MGLCASNEPVKVDASQHIRNIHHHQPSVTPAGNLRESRSSAAKGGAVLSTGNERETASDQHAKIGSMHMKGFDSASRYSSQTASRPTTKQTTPAFHRASWTPEKMRSPYGAVPLKGEAVAVVGLRKLPEYNGRVGIVKSVPLNNFVRGRTSLKRKPRYAVFLPGWSQLLNIRMENLCVLDRHHIPVVVKEGEAGLDFHKDDCGWLVTSVSQTPGQTHLRKRDIIIAVDGKSLMCRSSQEQTRIIKTRLRHGAYVDILRTPSRNRSRRERPRSDYAGRAKKGQTTSSTGGSGEGRDQRRRRLSSSCRTLIERAFSAGLDLKGLTKQQKDMRESAAAAAAKNNAEMEVEGGGRENQKIDNTHTAAEEPHTAANDAGAANHTSTVHVVKQPLSLLMSTLVQVLAALRRKRFPDTEDRQVVAWAEGRSVQIASECGVKIPASKEDGIPPHKRSGSSAKTKERGGKGNANVDGPTKELGIGTFEAMFESIGESSFSCRDIEEALRAVLK
mmetsp:Transcript_1782/g.3211  ORF Transcript_1782/g.3211 Transcript_1782/m.3211 type:complete len:505 (+) Transcript_1782:180-1694(+)